MEFGVAVVGAGLGLKSRPVFGHVLPFVELPDARTDSRIWGLTTGTPVTRAEKRKAKAGPNGGAENRAGLNTKTRLYKATAPNESTAATAGELVKLPPYFRTR